MTGLPVCSVGNKTYSVDRCGGGHSLVVGIDGGDLAASVVGRAVSEGLSFAIMIGVVECPTRCGSDRW